MKYGNNSMTYDNCPTRGYPPEYLHIWLNFYIGMGGSISRNWITVSLIIINELITVDCC